MCQCVPVHGLSPYDNFAFNLKKIYNYTLGIVKCNYKTNEWLISRNKNSFRRKYLILKTEDIQK